MVNDLLVYKCLQNAKVVVKDAFTHIYVMSEHQDDITRYDLGQGAFASSISLLATLNLLAKIHFILMKGKSVIVGQEEITSFNEVKNKIKNCDTIKWSEAEPFLRRRRLGEMNETEAFVTLIQSCPIEFGLPRDDASTLRKVWSTFRNKLTHLASLANDVNSGQMLVTLRIEPSSPGMFKTNLDFIKRSIHRSPPFDIPPATTRTRNLFGVRSDIELHVKQMITNDCCRVDSLAVAIEMTIDWLTKKITNNDYTSEHLEILEDWLATELSPMNKKPDLN